MKKCTKCSLTLPVEEFYKSKQTKDGRLYWCKSCFNKNVRDRYRTPEGRYVTLKKDAKARKIPFSLTMEEYRECYSGRCGYCNGEVKNAAGIDRIDNSIGYEVGNIIPSCKWCNYAKGTWSARSFYEKCLKVVENFPEELKKTGEKYTDEIIR